MYEGQTYEVILERLLERVPESVDKREGSIAYDAVAPAALEIAMLYWELDNAIDETYADTSSREFLIRRAKERNIIPKEATNAVVKGRFEPSTVELPEGTRFNIGEFNYVIMEKLSDGVYMLRCETPGIEPNTATGEVTPIEYIEGLSYGEISEVLVLGEDEEDTEDFRERYFRSFKDQASGGNVAWYKEELRKLRGVGGVKVLRAWDGAGTVKTIIQNSSYSVPTKELIDEVQSLMDPEQNQGEGLGLAPIGHTVTIEGVTSEIINISTKVTLEPAITWEDVAISMQSTVDEYFLELNEEWENQDNIIVRISQIESRLVAVAGIVDIENTKINGLAANYIVPTYKVVARGTVTNG